MKKPVTKPKRTAARPKANAVKRGKPARVARKVGRKRDSQAGASAPASLEGKLPKRQAVVAVADLTVKTDSVSTATTGVISDASGQGTLPAASEDSMTTYQLPSTFDVSTVAQVHAGLRALSGNVRLDGTKVEQVDTAAAQLLAAFALRGPTVRLAASPTLADFLNVTALGAVLCLEA